MRIALISCTSSKMDYSCWSAEMYSASPRFSLAYKYAKQVADVVYIISAKHGLLAEDDVIEPYNESLIHKSRDERKQWSIKVLDALSEKHSLESDVFVVLAGCVYNEYLIPEFKHYELPLEGLSMGWWIPKLRELIGEDGHESDPKPKDHWCRASKWRKLGRQF